jgi:hypothetical protein
MSRQELVAAATAAGIAKASSTKTADLEAALKKMKVTKKPKGGKRGRPTVEGCARQTRLAARAQRAEANGGVVKRGRPAVKKMAEAAELAQTIAEGTFGEREETTMS